MKHSTAFSLQLLLLFLCCLGSSCGSVTKSHETHIDHAPDYRSKKRPFEIEKIEYQSDRTVFHFKAKLIYNIPIVLHPVASKDAWYLEEVKSGRQHALQAIRQVRINETLVHKELQDTYQNDVSRELHGGVLRCELHFKRLPKRIKQVHLIEGQGRAQEPDYFNFFDLKINNQQRLTLGPQPTHQPATTALHPALNQKPLLPRPSGAG